MHFTRQAFTLLLMTLCKTGLAQLSADQLIYSTDEAFSDAGYNQCMLVDTKGEAFVIRNIFITGNKKTNAENFCQQF